MKTSSLVKENSQLYDSTVRVQQELQKLGDEKREQSLEIESLNDKLVQSYK